MTSNILAGERRWASARRTGMTVLGKVAVPKPLNLPSQRLENHGVDPNVDIVPKGSGGWGSRPSSSASNPWGSSALSPNADGSASSPSHLSGRPSSGGSGSRPSTAGSERTHERSGNAWGVSSRPSSASGTSSNQTSLRPHSAETRPNSSQLSRFAEPVSEVVSRGLVGTTEKGVVTSSDRFSLISGDFPTLSSSKENSAKNHESQDQGSHSRPSSASSRCVQKKDWADASQPDADVSSGTVNTWSRDGPQNGGDGIPPDMEKWQREHREPQKYHNPNIPPPQFDTWRGPPMNGPAGVWYRGPPPGPPYGAPVPPVGPGGFPVEPFPYYCPQIPPAALTNSQSVPLPGAGPRGPRPKNGEMFRPHMGDAFVRPGMPFRPGFYHGPVPFEGYYGPPMGYHNSNEREVPFKGTGGGPSTYNRYPVLSTPDTGNSHAKTGMSATGKTLPAQVESVHSVDPSGQYKVLLKQKNECDAKERAENKEHMPTSKPIHAKERGQPAMSYRKNEWGADHNSEDEMYPANRLVENSSPCNFDDRVGYSSDQVKSFGSPADVTVEDSSIKKLEPSFHGMLQPSSASGRGLTTSVRDSSLIQKIEGLNEKVRASDGRSDGVYTSHWEGKKGSNALAMRETSVSAGDRTSDFASGSRRPYEGVHSKHNDASKRRFNSLDVDGHKKPVPAESFNLHAANVIPSPNVQDSKINPTIAPAEGSLGNIEGESLSEGLDSTDTQAQRAKMRELAKQRAIQLQKEEEERTREQKAKAFAKLEELNRRTQGVNGPSLTAENAVPTGVSQHEIEISQMHVDSQCLNSAIPSNAAIVTQVNENLGEWSSEEAVPLTDSSIHMLRATNLDPGVLHGPLLPLKEEMHHAGDFPYKPAPQVNEPGLSRHKRNSHKRLNGPPQMDACVKSAAFDASKSAEDSTEITPYITEVAPTEMESRLESGLPSISNNVAESSVQQRRKSNRNSKNKHKLDSAPPAPGLALAVSNESNSVELSAENEMSNASQSDLDSLPVGAEVTASDGTGSSDLRSSLPNEGVLGKVSNLRKPQQSRRFPRNQQSNRFSDKYHGNDNVVWAPVRSQSKSEPGPEMGQKPVEESVTSTKGDNHVQGNLKNKRAEMERYVPKPVAKELAQQGGVQQSVPSSVGLSTSDETGEKVESQLLNSVNMQPGNSATGNVESIVESERADSKHNKQSKVHGAWRQRSATESHVKGWQNVSSSSTSNSNMSSQGGQCQFVKTDLNSVKADHGVSSEFGASDSGNILNECNAVAPVISPQGRDLGATGKGKRHPIKGERNRGNDNEQEKNLNYWEPDRSSSQLGDTSVNQTEQLASSRESKGLEERTSSHWQPKSNSLPNNSLRGGRTISNQTSTGEASGLIKKNHPSQAQVDTAQHISNNSRVDQSESENKIFSGAVNVGHQGHGKEKKQSSFKGRPFSPSDVSVGDESTHPMNADLHNKQHVSSDFRRNRNQNNRPSANRDSRADWNPERHRQNAHYEYQPVGPYNNNRTEKIEDVSNNMGPRYKDRSQSHPKHGRGNYHGRQSGNVRADAGCG